MTPRATHTVRLPDGTTGLEEYGDPAGGPVLFCHGIPGSRWEAEAFDDAASAAGLRIVAIDRPGSGLSTPNAQTYVGDWSETALAVANLLDLERFAVIGVSGGGPFALACAARCGERVTAVATVSAPAPFDAPRFEVPVEAAARARRRGLNLLRRMPFLVRPVAARMASMVCKPDGIATLLAQMAAVDQERVAGDPELAAKLEANIHEAFRQGSGGFAEDMRKVFTRPWGFALTEITTPVAIWHGLQDTNLPVAEAHRLAAAIPASRIHLVPGGHLLFVDQPAAILASLAPDASSR